MTVTADLATKMWEKFEILRTGGTKEMLQWLILISLIINKVFILISNYRILHAYSPLILGSSDMRLKVVRTGHKQKGFEVRASCDIQESEYVYELVGLVLTDSQAEHIGLLAIIPHAGREEDLEPCLLFGPVRFINH
jgi:hypothetical protein